MLRYAENFAFFSNPCLTELNWNFEIGNFNPLFVQYVHKSYYDYMIYRQSNDPVFLKKINIDVWLLRDQLEQIVLTRLSQDPNAQDFNDLLMEFAPKPKPNLTLLKFEKDNPESNNNNEPPSSDNKEPPTSDAEVDDQENNTSEDEVASNSSSLEENDTEKEIITQRIPQLEREKICHGKTFLSEIYMDQMLFFSDRQFIEGSSIVIQFNLQREIYPQRRSYLFSNLFSKKQSYI